MPRDYHGDERQILQEDLFDAAAKLKRVIDQIHEIGINAGGFPVVQERAEFVEMNLIQQWELLRKTAFDAYPFGG